MARGLDAIIAAAHESLKGLSIDGLTAETLAVLSDALEELEVTSEELRAQNQELAELHQQVEVAHRKYRRLFTYAPDVYLLTNRYGVIGEANRQAARMLRATRRQLRGSLLITRVPFSERRDFRRRLVALAAGQDQRGWLTWLQPLDATRRAVSMEVTIDQETESGDDLRLRWLVHDVDQLTDRAARLQHAFNQEQDRATSLEDVNRWKTSLLRTAAHDIRQPLHNIMGAAGTLRASGDALSTEHAMSVLEMIQRNGKRLDTLISDLMEVDRLTVGGTQLRRQAVDVGDLVRGTLDAIDTEDRLISLDLPHVVASIGRVEFERVVENLVRNAMTHTAPDTPIWVRIRARENVVHLTIEDAGPGVPPRERERIFAPFQRGTTNGAGTGLGLSLVRLFAELHGGTAVVTDRPGGGASFQVALPAHARVRDAAAAAPATDAAS